MSAADPNRWAAACTALLLLHVAFGLVRIPGKVYGKRAGEVADYRAAGAAHHLLDRSGLGGADVVDWLQANVPPDRVVLWRGGPTRGAFEVLAGLIAPRLLVAEAGVAPGATSRRLQGGTGRQLAQGTLPDGRRGVLVVEVRADGLALDIR